MFHGLPEPEQVLLGDPPAERVSFSLNFEAERPFTPSSGLKWQAALGEHGIKLPLIKKVREQTLQVNAAAGSSPVATPVATRDGWLCTNDSTTVATLFADGLTIDRQQYPGFEVFRAEIEAAVRSAKDVLDPSVRTLMTLRYANALSAPEATSPGYWEGKVTPSFLGVGMNEPLRDDVFSTITLVEFRMTDGVIARVRAALQPDQVHANAVAFAFDIEMTDVPLGPYDTDGILAKVKEMNLGARQLFQTILTPDYFAKLKG